MSLADRTFWAILALAPIAATTDRPAHAAPPASSTLSGPLPHGIHLGRKGRYYEDACDHDRPVHCMAQRLLPIGYRPGDALSHVFGIGGGSDTPPAGSMGPPDVVAAYSLASVPSRGGIVAIEDFPDATALNDVNVYRRAYGIAPLQACTGAPTATGTPCFAVYDQDGNANPTGLEDGGSADGETSFDMDMISAGCPSCSILLIEWTGTTQGEPGAADFQAGAATAASLGANAVSISYGGFEGTGDPASGYTVPGKMLLLVASGDDGYDLETEGNGGGGGSGGGGGKTLTPDYPASSPDVLGVGGTLLSGASGSSYTEVVWNSNGEATTSGCSTEFPMPAYQTAFGASKFGACTMRATSDLSAAADFESSDGSGGGIAMYLSTGQQPGFQPWVGTSASSPLTAAIFTRLGLTTQISSDFGFLYRNLAAFNDVTSGTDDLDGECTDEIMCTAGAGWDGPTGVGTPNGAKLLALAGSGSGSGSGTGGDAGTGASDDAGGGGSSSGGAPGGGTGGGSPIGSGSGSGSSSGGSDDAGASLPAEDSGAPEGPGGFETAGASSGCRTSSQATPASEGESELFAVLAGGVALVAARRRRR